MKLILSVAVLVIALSVMLEYASAQESDSIGDHFRNFGHKVKDLATTVGKKTKKTFQDIAHSNAVTKTRNWFSNAFKKMKEGVSNSSR